MATKNLKIALALIKNLFFIGCLFIRLFMLFAFFFNFFQLIHGFHLHVFSMQLSHYYWNIKLNFFLTFFYSNKIGLTSNVLWITVLMRICFLSLNFFPFKMFFSVSCAYVAIPIPQLIGLCHMPILNAFTLWIFQIYPIFIHLCL